MSSITRRSDVDIAWMVVTVQIAFARSNRAALVIVVSGSTLNLDRKLRAANVSKAEILAGLLQINLDSCRHEREVTKKRFYKSKSESVRGLRF